MVRLIIFFILVIPLTVFADEAITGDALKSWLAEAEHEHQQHSKEIKSNKLHELLGQNNTKEIKTEKKEGLKPAPESPANTYDFFAKTPPTKPESIPKIPVIKPKTNNNPELKDIKPKTKPEEEKQASDKNRLPYIGQKGKTKTLHANPKKETVGKDPDRYTPPSWRDNNKTQASPIHSGRANPAKKGPVFGIRLGAEFRAKLKRTTTNVEPTLAEFIVVDDVYGDFKMLHKNTKLFARKTLSTSSNRLYFNCVKGITPAGVEFDIEATVTDVTTNKLAGLTGAITTDNKMIKRSVATGAFAAGTEVLKTAPGTSVLGHAASSAADSALSEKEKEADAKLGQAKFVIYVNPQDVFIRVDETF